MNQYNYLFKLILVGDSGVGKSCLLMRFIDGRFREDHDATIGVEFGTKMIDLNEYTLKIQIWDTAGQESFKSITRSYFKGAIGALIVFDVTRKVSFENLIKWRNDIKEQGKEEIIVLIIGNKNDLHDQREVSEKEAQDFADSLGCKYFETSAKNGTNSYEAFSHLAEDILNKVLTSQIDYSNESSGVKVGTKGQTDQGQPFPLSNNKDQEKKVTQISSSSLNKNNQNNQHHQCQQC